MLLGNCPMARLLGAAALCETISAPQVLRGREEVERTVAAALGEECWAVAFVAGQALSLEEAIAEVLEMEWTATEGDRGAS
jgi:hypothetical protein